MLNITLKFHSPDFAGNSKWYSNAKTSELSLMYRFIPTYFDPKDGDFPTVIQTKLKTETAKDQILEVSASDALSKCHRIFIDIHFTKQLFHQV